MSFDAIIIGAGPAGLVAATYLARFRRRVLLVHDADSRARWITRTHNVPGYPLGIEGDELLRRLEEQTALHGVERLAARVSALAGRNGDFEVRTADCSWHARRLLLATGVHDLIPENLNDLWPLVTAGLVRLCPVCDAFEFSGKRIGLLANGERCTSEARFLRQYCQSITLLSHGVPYRGAIEARIASASRAGDCLVLGFDDGDTLELDALYVALGVQVHSELATRLGARADEVGYLTVDQKQQTSVPGLYAAGDVVQSLSQISVAFGQAAIAASAINVALLHEES